jgi:hypothetical protein
LYVNNSLEITRVLPGNTDDFDTALNKINLSACMILWEFRYYDTELLPTDMYPALFTTSGCSYGRTHLLSAIPL